MRVYAPRLATRPCHPAAERSPSRYAALTAALTAALAVGCSSEPADFGGVLPDAVGGGFQTDGGGGPTGDTGAGGADDALAGDGGGSTGDDAGGGGQDAFVPDGPKCGGPSGCKDTPETPICATNIGVCVECVIDFHCQDSTGNCENYACVDVSCAPGSTVCDGNFLATCNAAGDGYDKAACPSETPVCVSDACRVCEPNTTSCAPPAAPGQPSKQVVSCNADGSEQTVVQTCDGAQSCVNGACGVCVPGEKRCEGAVSQYCATDGSGWLTLEDCGETGKSCVGGLCVGACSADVKSNTHVGCDYWAVDLDNAVDQGPNGTVYDAQSAQFSLIVSNTTGQVANVKVTLGLPNASSNMTTTVQVQPQQVSIIDLPDPSWNLPHQSLDGSGVSPKGYRVESDQPIVAYQFNPLQNFGVFSNDASLLLPTNSVGKEYWIASRNQLGDKFRSYFTVIAAESGETEVKVVTTAPTLGGPGAPAMSVGQTQTYKLQHGEVLNIQSNQEDADLTGSWVQANKRVVVFGGSEASNSPQVGRCVPGPGGFGGSCIGTFGAVSCTTDAQCPAPCCADHLEEQLFPVDAWGSTYVGARLAPRGLEEDAWRIIAAEAGTTVQIQPNIGVTVPTLGQGQVFEFQTTKDFVLTSNKPVQLVQYMASSYATATTEDGSCSTDSQCLQQHGFMGKCDTSGIFGGTCAPIGDPSMILAVSTDQYLDDYLFLVPDKYEVNYINIVTPLSAKITLDGQQLTGNVFTVVPNSQWAVARLPVQAGPHRLQATVGVGLYVYGYDDDVSFGYPGGAGLATLE
jgi:hypothetical protein